MDLQGIEAILGTAAGVVSAYYGYLQHKKSSRDKTTAHTDADREIPSRKPEPKLWSQAVDTALETFKKSRPDCAIEIVEQKNFDKFAERFSTSELILYVRYQEATESATPYTHKFEIKINKDGDLLEVRNKGKRLKDGDRFR